MIDQQHHGGIQSLTLQGRQDLQIGLFEHLDGAGWEGWLGVCAGLFRAEASGGFRGHVPEGRLFFLKLCCAPVLRDGGQVCPQDEMYFDYG